MAQKDESVEDPKFEDIHKIGTVARILKVLKMHDGNTTVIIKGKKRFQITELVSEDPYLTAKIKNVDEVVPSKEDGEFAADIESVSYTHLTLPTILLV